jgi:hypothetical protein
MVHLKVASIAMSVLACAALLGCGARGEKLVPVAGQVTIDGVPLKTGSVTYHADAAKGNSTPHIPVGVIDADGRYKLASATKEGAPPGWYRVTVTAQEPIDPKNPYALPKYLIDPKYGDAITSSLEVEVAPNKSPSAYDLKLAK